METNVKYMQIKTLLKNQSLENYTMTNVPIFNIKYGSEVIVTDPLNFYWGLEGIITSLDYYGADLSPLLRVELIGKDAVNNPVCFKHGFKLDELSFIVK